MGAVENVLVAAAARHRGDLAAVEADAHAADELRLGGRGGFPHGAAEVETCRQKCPVNYQTLITAHAFIRSCTQSQTSI